MMEEKHEGVESAPSPPGKIGLTNLEICSVSTTGASALLKKTAR